jgi:hypothetical protein
MRNSGLTKSEQPSTGVSAMCERNFQLATEPLFQAGEVDVLEWSFDTAWGMPVSDWLTTQLQDFSTRGNLLGHGVSFSPFSGRWSTRQDAWLQHLGIELDRNPMRWVSEHFGFMDAGDFHQSSPLPVPLNEETLLVGQNRLSQLASVSSGPVGLENLAFAFSAQAMWQQGEFLDQLLAPVGVFCCWICTTFIVRRGTSTVAPANCWILFRWIEFVSYIFQVVPGTRRQVRATDCAETLMTVPSPRKSSNY